MVEMRKCIGSAKFGIVAHDAPSGEFPIQPSQKDGLGRMCRSHWSAYTTALRKAALARKAADAGTAPAEVAPADDVKPAKAKARSGGALRRAHRPADADDAPGSIADFTAVPEAAPVGGRKPTAPKPGSTRVRNAKALVAAIETLGGAEYTDAVGSDEVQAALEVLGSRADDRVPADLAQEETAVA